MRRKLLLNILMVIIILFLLSLTGCENAQFPAGELEGTKQILVYGRNADHKGPVTFDKLEKSIDDLEDIKKIIALFGDAKPIEEKLRLYPDKKLVFIQGEGQEKRMSVADGVYVAYGDKQWEMPEAFYSELKGK